VGGALFSRQRRTKVRKQLFIALALLTFICPSLRTASAQPTARPAPGTPAAPSLPDSAKGNASGFKEVTKEKFKEIYFRHGGGKRSGWTAEYWQEFFENKAKPGWKYMVEEPRSAKHIRMNIITDNKAKEYRMFFMTEEDEEDSSD
jgi:hypothetical protein